MASLHCSSIIVWLVYILWLFYIVQARALGPMQFDNNSILSK